MTKIQKFNFLMGISFAGAVGVTKEEYRDIKLGVGLRSYASTRLYEDKYIKDIPESSPMRWSITEKGLDFLKEK